MMEDMLAIRGFVLVLLLALTSAGSCGTATERESATEATESVGNPADTKPPGKESKPTPESESVAPPEDPAPDFSVETFDGETFSLAEQRGTPVVLNFWESW